MWAGKERCLEDYRCVLTCLFTRAGYSSGLTDTVLVQDATAKQSLP